MVWKNKKHLVSSICGKKREVNERSDEKGQTGQRWQEGDSHANDQTLQKWYPEEHLWKVNASKQQKNNK